MQDLQNKDHFLENARDFFENYRVLEKEGMVKNINEYVSFCEYVGWNVPPKI